ncbi:rab proteins geranylgeranyltransferase component A [Cordyceps fumosorosea ARSEF 2679]|uniref:Rab proteins geranylgeranyltransferase n=1 Tax=Cordyceps fumosorosea (strain ARSEF 2679) TaxID=1081104 RepID=A0A162J869_CORFA|nr:rab proteins geranylgeranyltransferase component A [Cordyceps fumosorosea ARSEF 2679]OAA54187.1 rab proteins geranylgeranyltransferase component A [Cordyceps fumosorosea ARSEF 2679]
MESLSDTDWDVVISGTGLQQSLFALALSRSGKNILHVDAQGYYGQHEAAFSLQEVDAWAARHASPDATGLFRAVEVTKAEDGLPSPRAYSLALAPQLIHARSELLGKLVSSKAFRQIEFQAVGSFFIFQRGTSKDATMPVLARIPSTREDVFSSTAIPVRAKRSLMKFLKFVLAYESEPQAELWKPHADKPLAEFLASQFNLDATLQSYIITLTLSLDGNIAVEDGLAVISRHLSSMGVFGAGFAAVYPKWGGLSEVCQVGCRAAAVGGAVYMLGTGITGVAKRENESAWMDISLSNDTVVKTKKLVRGSETSPEKAVCLTRTTAVVAAALPKLFEAVVEGSPTPSATVIAFPTGSVSDGNGHTSEYPIYAMVHSSDTGECPTGQCIVYLSTISTASSKALLETALLSLLHAATAVGGQAIPEVVYKLQYEQVGAKTPSLDVDEEGIVTFGAPVLDLAFRDTTLQPVRQAWEKLTGLAGEEADAEYYVFEDREGVDDEDDVFDG